MPTSPFVVLSKLTPPITSQGLVERSSLVEQFELAIDARLLLLVAPAGYGKTTAAAAYYRNRKAIGNAVGWVSMDTADRDPARFLAHLIGALQTGQQGVGLAAQSLLSVGGSVSVRSILLTLFNEIAAVNRHLTVVFDDFYRCASEETLELTEALLRDAPNTLQIVLTSRSMPELACIPQLRAHNRLAEVRAEDLRFDLMETSAFFNQSLRLNLDRAQIRALHERTDGWVTGLQLAGLSLRHRSDRAHFIAEFSGNHRDIVEYLAGDVLANLSEKDRCFLQETAILERLTASLCDAVTNRSGSAAMLDALERANMFMLPLDDSRSWYRYHHLFADFLRSGLQRERPEILPQLHRRAYAWFASHGMIGEAVGHAIEAGDWERAASFIESSWKDEVKMGHIRTILEWIKTLPNNVLDRHPILHIAQSWALALRRDHGQALEHFRLARSKIESADFDRSQLSTRDYTALVWEVRTTEILVHVFADAEDEMVAASGEELDNEPEYDPFVHGVRENVMIYASHVAGKFDQARRYAVRARERHMRADGIYGAVYSDCFRGLVEIDAGALDVAETFYGRAQQLASEKLGRLSVPAALPAVLITEVYYLRNRLDEAHQNLDEMLYIVDECAVLDAALIGHRVQAQLFLAAGCVELALDAIAEAEAIGRRSGFERLVISALTQRVRVLAAAGDFNPAETALKVAESLAGSPPPGEYCLRWSRRWAMIAQARAVLCIAQGRADEAMEILAPWIVDAESTHRVKARIELLVLDAVARVEIGDERGAIRRLGKALSLSSRNGMIRVYADEGARMKHLFLRAREQWAQDPQSLNWPAPQDHIAEVSVAIGCDTSLHSNTPNDPFYFGVAPKLSERELEVLRALLLGRSNKQIARQLDVAVSTIAWHLKNIYSKLHVSRRTEAVAVARARELC